MYLFTGTLSRTKCIYQNNFNNTYLSFCPLSGDGVKVKKSNFSQFKKFQRARTLTY